MKQTAADMALANPDQSTAPNFKPRAPQDALVSASTPRAVRLGQAIQAQALAWSLPARKAKGEQESDQAEGQSVQVASDDGATLNQDTSPQADGDVLLASAEPLAGLAQAGGTGASPALGDWVLAQASPAAVGAVAPASAAAAGAGSAAGASASFLPLAFAAGGIALVAATNKTTVTPTTTGRVIDGYIAGATVFVDSDKDGQLDANEFSTTSDAQGNFTLPQGLSGPVVAVGGRDISTGLNFTGVLKAPAGSTVVTPLTTLVTELISTNANLSVSAAQDQVLDAVGLSALKGQVDLTKLDPVAGAAAGTAGALDVHKAGVAVATLVNSLTVKVQETAGVGADKHDEIAGGIFSQLASSLSAGKLSTSQIAATGTAVVNTIAAQATVGGVSVTNGAKLKTDSVSTLENLADLASKISSATSVDTVTSGQKTALTKTTYTLQLLHFADAEAGMLASSTAPKLAALVDKFEDAYANSITLAGGDNFLPGPFLAAGTDDGVRTVFNSVTGSTVTGTMPIAGVDIALHNLMGVQASAVGNHEFDLGSNVLVGAFGGGSGFGGAQFPYISANLDVSADSALKARYTDTTATAGLEEASSLKGRMAPSAVITEGGAKIGLVGATTQLLESISSPSGTKVKDNDNVRSDDMDLLAAQLQPVIDDLIAQGVNKIILMAHLQVLANEKLLATKLKGVDIILAAGSNTRLGDTNDTAVAFAGHAANFADAYPLVIKDKDGKNTLVVNTDNEFTYLGRLVVDFDANGEILPASLTANSAINGAYAATDANVAAAWGASAEQLSTTAYASGTRGGQVKALTDAVQSVITTKDGSVYGYADVYLEGERIAVRNQETNLGNLSADANTYALEQALGSAAAQTYIVSLKNGGGIRAQIGTLSAPKPDGSVDKLPPEGGVSQLDVENSLRFNNQLMAFDTSPVGLKAILEHGVASLGSQGRFPQLGGVSFSYDPDLPAGSRVGDVALVDDGYRVNLYNDGVLLAGAPAKITVVTLNFLANGGDSYPIKANGENFRYVVEQTGGSFALTAPVDEAKNFTEAATITAAVGSSTLLSEQKAFEVYMKAFHATPQTAYKQAETAEALDTRIQNLNVRSEDVISTAVTGAQLLNASIDGLGDAITLYFDRALDGVNLPTTSQFSVLGASSATGIAVTSVQVYDNQVRLRLASALPAGESAQIAFRDPTTGNDTATLQALGGGDVLDLRGVSVTQRLSQQSSGSENFVQAATVTLAGAEISAFDPGSKRLFVTSPLGLQVLSVDADLKMTLLGTVTLGSNDVNSVAVKDGLVAVAVAASDKTQPGSVYFLDADAALSVTAGAIATQGFVVGTVTVGALPDMLTFTADGKKLLVANEAEQNDVDGPNPPALVNPEGSVSIIDLSAGAASATVTTASFAAFNSKAAELRAKGVRLFAGQTGFENITVAQDLEPEYIAIAPDGKAAFVTLQENNALALLDLATGQFTDIVPLGRKSFFGLPFDGSDRDGASNANAVALSTERPVFGQYMPDAIAAYLGADGKAYYLIANEGDDRDDFIAPNETTSVSSSSYVLDPTAFPDGAALKTNAQIGRLTVSNAPGNKGDTDGDGDIDQILAYGARSFSIVDAQGRIVFDSGSHIEQFFAAGGIFSGASPSTSGLFDDSRSDNKGPEPEGITVGQVGSKTLAFVGLERGGGGVMVYDVTHPGQVSFVQYLRNSADVSPEGLTFVAAKDSPSGQDALFVTNEVSLSVTAYESAQMALSKVGTFATNTYNAGGAEIVAFDAATKRLFLVNALAAEIQVVSVADPANPTLLGKLDFTGYASTAGTTPQVNSVAASGGLVAVALADANPTQAGKVILFKADVTVGSTAAAPAGARALDAGVGPDMVTFTPDGKKVLVANEAESINERGSTDPYYNAGQPFVANGGITVVTLGVEAATAIESATVQQLDLTAYNGKEGWLRERGVRIAAGATASNDLEPEYIAVSPDGKQAMVTLQENNAVAVLDLSSATAKWVDIVPMGYKNHARGDLVMAAYDTLSANELGTIGTDAFGQAVPAGGFSGLHYSGQVNGKWRFLTVSDRGPNGEPINVDTDAALERPFVLPNYQARVSTLEFDPVTEQMSIVRTTLLTKSDGSPLSGLPNVPGTDEEPVQIVPASDSSKTGTFTSGGTTLGYKTLAYDPLGADLEGVYQTASGSMWMVDEYRPAVYEFDASGKMVARFVPVGTAALTADATDSFGTETLPAHLTKRQANRGFEALAVDEANGLLFGFVQSPLDAASGTTADTAGPLIRIEVMAMRDLAAGAALPQGGTLSAAVSKGTVIAEYAYLLERPALRLGQLDKIGDAVFNPATGTIFVFERDSDVLPEAKKVLYEIDLRGATNLLTATPTLPEGKAALELLTVDELLGAGINPVYKEKLANLPSLGFLPNDKAEGLALLPDGSLAVINDNDFGVNGAGTETVGLGILKFNSANGIDADNDTTGQPSGTIAARQIVDAKLYGAYMPDSIAAFSAQGKTYYITANEGDSRGIDEVQIKDLGKTGKPSADASAGAALLDGDLKVLSNGIDVDGDGDLDKLVAFGGRSFSILDAYGNLIYDSGDQIERLIAETLPSYFNASHTNNSLDNRSDDKGPEPEAVVTALVGGKVYAMVGLERIGGVAVYDVSDPYQPSFVSYSNARDFSQTPALGQGGDLGPEGLLFIPAASSPSGLPLVAVANEISGTVGLFHFAPMPTSESNANVWLASQLDDSALAATPVL